MNNTISKPTRMIAAIILTQKLLLAVLLLIAPSVMPSFFPTPTSVKVRFSTWDTEHYLDIAMNGYTPKAGHCAFYPLWPLTIRLGTYFTSESALLSGYILGNIFSLFALLLFHHLIWEKHGLPLANRATMLLLLYPSSIFFFFPYTESLFLLLLMTCLFCAHRGNAVGTAVASFFLPMTRAVGIFVLPVLFCQLLLRRAPLKSYAICGAPLLGYLCYFAIMNYLTGNPFEGFEAQQKFPAKPSIAHIADLAGFAQNFAELTWSHDMMHSFIDRGAFFIFLCSLYWIWRIDSAYLTYALFTGLIPALSNSLMSYSRFLALVFPIFIVFATATMRRSWLFFPFCILCGVAQVYFFLRHASGQWVG